MAEDWQSRAAEYEAAGARALGIRHVIAFAFARHALAAALKAAGAEQGDEVVLSPLTCKVVPLTLLWAGLTPIYADISPTTLNLDATQIEARVGPRTRAILFQHTYGGGQGVEAVSEVARRRGLVFVEDCAQCLPLNDGRYAPGRTGRAAIFSCNLLKPLPAGSGGLLVTDDEELSRRVRDARDRLPERGALAALALRAEDALFRALMGPRTYWTALGAYQVLSPTQQHRSVATEVAGQLDGLAYRPSAFQLSNGSRWMHRIEQVATHRRACCAGYRKDLSAFAGVDLLPAGGDWPLMYFPILTSHKAGVISAAKRRRLQLVAWPGSTPIYPVEDYKALPAYGYEPGSCPVAESVASRLIGLPTDLEITQTLRRRIADLVVSYR